MRYFRNFDEYYAYARGKAEKLTPKVYRERRIRKEEAQEEPKEEVKKAPKPRKKKGDE